MISVLSSDGILINPKSKEYNYQFHYSFRDAFLFSKSYTYSLIILYLIAFFTLARKQIEKLPLQYLHKPLSIHLFSCSFSQHPAIFVGFSVFQYLLQPANVNLNENSKNYRLFFHFNCKSYFSILPHDFWQVCFCCIFSLVTALQTGKLLQLFGSCTVISSNCWQLKIFGSIFSNPSAK